jgi:hypothetical protein
MRLLASAMVDKDSMWCYPTAEVLCANSRVEYTWGAEFREAGWRGECGAPDFRPAGVFVAISVERQLRNKTKKNQKGFLETATTLYFYTCT